MGHLKNKYSSRYFLGGIDVETQTLYGVLGHAEFREDRIHERLVNEFNFTCSLLGELRGLDVLDIGFGRGDRIPLFLKESVASYTGIDFSSFALRIARKKFKDHRVRLLQLDATKIEAEGAFDLVAMYDVIEHIPAFEMEIVWPKIYRALRRGGYIVLSTPLFENANAADHTERIPSVCGIHCNKQTLGTLMRTCLKHGFTVARSEDRIFALVRTEDLPVFGKNKREAYVKQHSSLLQRIGIKDFDGVLSNKIARMLVPGAGRVVMGCVTENQPKYLTQALRLLQSVRWFGGDMAGVNFFVCFVEEIDSEYASEFERLGAFVRKVRRFSKNHPHSNKLSFFDLPEIAAYDTIMLLDCDTVIVQDPSSFIDGRSLQAKIADLPTVPNEVFFRLFKHFKLPFPTQMYQCTSDSSATIWYCNAGVLVFPSELVKSFIPVWRDYNQKLIHNLELLAPYQFFCDQASLSLAFAANPVPFKELPVSMNFPLHLTNMKTPPEMMECDPVLLHYHDKVDSSGYLLHSPYAGAEKRILSLNERIRESRGRHFNNRLFWDFRYTHDPELGSGAGSRGAFLDYKRGILKEVIQDLKPVSILDVGCGDCAAIKDLPVNSYIGVDVSQVVVGQNTAKMPWHTFICGDFLALELHEADLVLCFDVLIHLSDKKVYNSFVERLVTQAGRYGIISGFEEAPKEKGDIVFHHEPLSATLKRYGARNVRNIGQYRNVMIWYYEKAASEVSNDALISSQAKLSAPVFLVGSMRSGTTPLADLLGQFPGIIHCPFELKDIWSSIGRVPMASAKTRDTVCYQMGVDDVKPEQAGRLAAAFLDRMQQHSTGKRENAIFLNKNPHLCNKLPFVRALFPNARFLWIYRPLPHVVASLKSLFEDVFNRQNTRHYWPAAEEAGTERCWFAFHGKDFPDGCDRERIFPGGNLRYLAEYWLESNSAVANYFSMLPGDRRLEIDEEELVNDPERQMKRCLAFLNQPVEIPPNMFKDLDPSRNARWKSLLSDEDLKILWNFVEAHAHDIKSIFPSQDYALLLPLKRLSADTHAASKKTKRAAKEKPHIEKKQPVCITGMHRTGTSMVARLLNICGLHLGEKKDLIGPEPDNPEGFWENYHFVNLNNEILSKLGGAWDLPPHPDRGWEQQPKFKSLLKKASLLIQGFEQQNFWGWKDPRSSLTAPFWNKLLNNLKFIICVRHPLEVAASLRKRGYNSKVFSLNLWDIYNQRLLTSTRPGQRIMTHYASYFKDPRSELRRVLAFLDVDISDESIDRACAVIKASLRHQRLGVSQAELPSKTKKIYDKLCRDAGPVYQKSLAPPPPPKPTDILQKSPSASSHADAATYDSQITAFERMILSNPKDISALNMLAELYLKKGDSENALRCYERVVELSPDDVDALRDLADVYKDQFSRFKDAYVIYEKIVKNNQDDAELLEEMESLTKLLRSSDGHEILFSQVKRIEEDSYPPESDHTISSNIERIEVHNLYFEISGWAYIDGEDSSNVKISLILKSDKNCFVAETLPVKRPDVTSFFHTLNYDDSGFTALISNNGLEDGEYQIIICIQKGGLISYHESDKKVVLKNNSFVNGIKDVETISPIDNDKEAELSEGIRQDISMIGEKEKMGKSETQDNQNNKKVDATKRIYQTHEPEHPGMSDSMRKLERLKLPYDLTGKRVLDIGCNEGFFCKIAKERGAARVVGIDSDAFRMGIAIERYGSLGIDFRRQNWDILPEGKFDVIIWASAMHYERDPKKVIVSIANTLAEDGLFILECGVVQAPYPEMKYFVRHSDVRAYPTYPYLHNSILAGFVVRDVAQGELTEGDPVPRFVYHCRHKKPEIVIIRGPSGIGKSSFLERNCSKTATKVIRMDHFIAIFCVAKYSHSAMMKFLQKNCNPNSLGPLYNGIDIHGFTEEYIRYLFGLLSPLDPLTVIEGFITDVQLAELKRVAGAKFYLWELNRYIPAAE